MSNKRDEASHIMQYERERLVKDLRAFAKDVERYTTNTADILELRDEVDTFGREKLESAVKDAARLLGRLKEYEGYQKMAKVLLDDDS